MAIKKGPANLGTGTIEATELASGSVTTGKLATDLVVTHALGSVSAPSITFTGDTNTGIYSPAADTIAFTEGGIESMRINSSGNILVNTSTARSAFFNASNTPLVQIEGTTFNTASESIVRNSADAAGSFLILGKTRGAAVGGTTLVSSGDVIGVLSFQGSDGTDLVEGARIFAVVDATAGANDMPAALVFNTTLDGAASSSERMRIDSSGNVGIGTTPSFRFHVNGTSGEYRTALFESASTNGPSVQIKGSKTYELRSTNTGAGEGAGLFFIYDKDNEASRLTINSSGVTAIKFAATQVASADANTLDDYEEGTWTPAWNTTNNNMSVTYSVQSGSYTKIGRMVYLRGYIKPNTISSQGTGQVVITGLPFAVVEEIGFNVTDGAGLSAYLSSTQSMLTGYGQNTTQLRPGTLGSSGNSYGINTGSVNTSFFLFSAYYPTT
jgi:hypothetical protein